MVQNCVLHQHDLSLNTKKLCLYFFFLFYDLLNCFASVLTKVSSFVFEFYFVTKHLKQVSTLATLTFIL